MNDLVQQTIIDVAPTDNIARNSLRLTLTPELGGDRDWQLADLDLSLDASDQTVLSRVNQALEDDGINVPSASFVVSRNHATGTISVFPKSQFGV